MVATVIIGVLVTAVIIIGVLSFVPYPNTYNVQVSVTSSELSLLIVSDYNIVSVNGQTTGQSAILDWSAFGLGLTGPSLVSGFTMQVCVGQSHCASKSATVWFPTLPIISGQSIEATDVFTIGYVPGGNQPISVSLTDGGNQVASGTGSLCVGC